jgi:hypothetical protein
MADKSNTSDRPYMKHHLETREVYQNLYNNLKGRQHVVDLCANKIT